MPIERRITKEQYCPPDTSESSVLTNQNRHHETINDHAERKLIHRDGNGLFYQMVYSESIERSNRKSSEQVHLSKNNL